jgi:16S rRNA (cytosine1402-N4)-methyltransferase
MKNEVLEALAVAPSDVVVDATLGGAGHFRDLVAALGADGLIVGIDADSEAVERAREALALDRREARPVAHLICDNFRNLGRILDRLDIAHFDKALFDLGWSGYQLVAGRGFSFQADEPLLMTYSSTELGAGSQSAAELVNSASEQELADLIYIYGEERYARRIAAAIVEHRRKERILTTTQLVAVIEAGVPAAYRKGKLHPATRTFQALRIAANDELGALKDALATALARVAPGGRIAIITFHSIEDRIVKHAFRAATAQGQGEELTKKPLAPTRGEVALNRRARSAKLRVFVRSTALAVTPTAISIPSYA